MWCGVQGAGARAALLLQGRDSPNEHPAAWTARRVCRPRGGSCVVNCVGEWLHLLVNRYRRANPAYTLRLDRLAPPGCECWARPLSQRLCVCVSRVSVVGKEWPAGLQDAGVAPYFVGALLVQHTTHTHTFHVTDATRPAASPCAPFLSLCLAQLACVKLAQCVTAAA